MTRGMSIYAALAEAADLRRQLLASTQKRRSLTDCCVGAQAAFQKLLLDRSAIGDEMLSQIVARLGEVIDDSGCKA